MIKELITDLAYEKVSLTQALTIAKLIANKTSSVEFKKWLTKELEGYEYEDTALPSYRNLGCSVFLTLCLPFGREQTLPVSFGDYEDYRKIMENIRATEAIRVIEDMIRDSDSSIWQLRMTSSQVEAVALLFKDSLIHYKGAVRGAYQEVGKSQYANIIELTKQKLLDLLIELDNNFPNLETTAKMTEAAGETVSTIITNNVYGGSSPLNFASGYNVTQTINIQSLTPIDEQKLSSLGVTDIQIQELKTTISSNKDGKEGLIKKSMKWLSSVTASMVARGAYEHLPQLQEFVSHIIDKF